MLISDTYRKLNEEAHKDENWGTTAGRFIPIIKSLGFTDILDYGAGKQILKKSLGKIVTSYDPCIPQISKKPKPHDLVCCLDVLEHVEPNYVDHVLDDLKRVVKKKGFFVVSTVPAIKILSDGRNAHLTVRPAEWWLEKILKRFKLERFELSKGEFAVFVYV